MKKLIIYTICFFVSVVFLIWLFSEIKLDKQGQQVEVDFDRFARELCCFSDIEYSGKWCISCPNCEDGAKMENSDVKLLENFRIGPDECTCRKCGHPVGMDWKIEELDRPRINDFNAIDISQGDDITIKNCKFIIMPEPNDAECTRKSKETLMKFLENDEFCVEAKLKRRGILEVEQ